MRVGLANAIAPIERRSRVLVALVTLTGLTATVWFANSLHDLGADPARWGYTWSSSPEAGFDAKQFPAAVDATVAHPDVANVAFLNTRDALVGDQPVTLSAITNIGDAPLRPRVLAGRLPMEGLEIALGRRTAAALDVEIDDIVQVDSTNLNPIDYRVVGFVLPPYQPGNTHPGEGAVLGASSMDALFPEAGGATYVLLGYAPTADRTQLESELSQNPGWVFGPRSHPNRPGEIANLMEASVMMPWLGGFFVTLGWGATALSASRRHTRKARDLEVLRALGFARGQIVRSAVAEATIVGAAGLLFGLPLGLFVGRTAWRLSIGDLGVVETQASVLVAVGAAVTAAIVMTMVSAVATSFRTGGHDAGQALRED